MGLPPTISITPEVVKDRSHLEGGKQYKVKRQILNEDSPPRRKHGFHRWMGTVTVIVGTWIFLAIGWIGLTWLY
jgi:hypothetical protein